MRKIAVSLGLLVVTFLCVLIAAEQLSITRTERTANKTLTAISTLTSTSTMTPVVLTVQPSLTPTMVPTETEMPTNTLMPTEAANPTADFLKQTQQVEEQIQKATPAG